MKKRQISSAVLALVAFGPVGCSTFATKEDKREVSFMERLPLVGKKKSDEQPEPYPNPVKMAATWTPDTLIQTGRTPTRGFGGRVFFYDEKSRPVPVDGTLVVHGFDDSITTPEQRGKRFEFTPEQFTRHFSQTDLGASYSVWIPWDAMGGEPRRISLVASFKTVEDKVIQGIPATVLLPGPTNQESKSEEMARFSPQYHEYQQAATAPVPSSGLSTTTIARRRSPLQHPADLSPNSEIPAAHSRDLIARGQSPTGATPSVDIELFKTSSPATVMPASASLPIHSN